MEWNMYAYMSVKSLSPWVTTDEGTMDDGPAPVCL